MSEEYDEFSLELSDLEEPPATKKKGNYTSSEKAKKAKADNLAKGRAIRKANLQQKKQIERQQQQVLEYEDE